MDENSAQSSSVDDFLLRYGIQVGFLVSGFFGSLLLVSKNSAQRLKSTIASIMAGTACANYLSPVVISFLPEEAARSGKYAIAFALGFMGLKGLEVFIEKFLTPKLEEPVAENAIQKTSRKRKKRAK